MRIKLVPFGIAKEIMDTTEKTVHAENVKSVGDLKAYLESKYERFRELRHFRLAVNEEYRNADFELSDNDEVVIIPPVSGG